MAKLAKLKSRCVPDLKSVLEEFLLFKAGDGASRRTLKDYRYHVESFLASLPSSQEDYEVLRKAAVLYLAQPVSAATRNIRLRYLKAFFNWCVSQGYLPASPVAGLKQSKEDLAAIRHVSLEDVKKLLDAVDRKSFAGLRDYCVILLQLDTGIRPGELFQLRVKDVNLQSREVYVPPAASKTRVGRTLVISEFTARALRTFLQTRPGWWPEEVPLFPSENGKPLDSLFWSKRLAKHSRKAGVRVTPYGLRHSFAIEFLKEANDPFALQRILGHQDLAMTRRYVRYLQEDIREAHEKASPVTRLAQLGKRAPRNFHQQ